MCVPCRGCCSWGSVAGSPSEHLASGVRAIIKKKWEGTFRCWFDENTLQVQVLDETRGEERKQETFQKRSL